MIIKYKYSDPIDQDEFEFNSISEFLKLHPIYEEFFKGERGKFSFKIDFYVKDYPFTETVEVIQDGRNKEHK